MNVVFMGTPDFSVGTLEEIIKAGHTVSAVVTQPDKPKGRGGAVAMSPVKEVALKNGLTVLQPVKASNPEFVEELRGYNPDVIVVVAFGQLLPKAIIDMPKYGCINVHASLLPKYRGAAPIQWSVLNGDKETGVTTMYMDIGMDTGDMILTEKVEIGEDETTGELWNRLSKIGANLLVETLKQIENGTAPRIPQGDDFTLAPMLDKEMSKIDWQNKSALEIKNLVRGLNPIMGTYSFLDGKKFKFWKVEILLSQPEYESQDNGTIIKSDSKDGLYIKAKDGIIKVIEIQAENAKKMNISDFLRGNVLEVGKKFE